MSNVFASFDTASLRQRADSGDAEAQLELGVRFYDGTHGVSQNYEQALHWFRKSADQGCASALNRLGRMYERGGGVHRDYAQAHHWYEKATEEFPENC